MQKTTNASWKPVVHKAALNELHDIPIENAKNLREIALEASKLKKPSDHSDIRLLRGDSMFRLRSGKYRALADLEPPELRILLVDHREYIYTRRDEARYRQTDH